MNVLEQIIKLIIIPLVLVGVPILFMLVFDIAAHLGELFGHK